MNYLHWHHQYSRCWKTAHQEEEAGVHDGAGGLQDAEQDQRGGVAGMSVEVKHAFKTCLNWYSLPTLSFMFIVYFFLSWLILTWYMLIQNEVMEKDKKLNEIEQTWTRERQVYK